MARSKITHRSTKIAADRGGTRCPVKDGDAGSNQALPGSAEWIAKFYITTPIYYVNARPHIGHTYTTIVCDAIARRQRMLGVDTYFLTGTDEHGMKIERSADAAGHARQRNWPTKSPREFKATWDRMEISYDDFIRTTDDRHKRGVQHLFRVLQRERLHLQGQIHRPILRL